jgi:hypothetical protein
MADIKGHLVSHKPVIGLAKDRHYGDFFDLRAFTPSGTQRIVGGEPQTLPAWITAASSASSCH